MELPFHFEVFFTLIQMIQSLQRHVLGGEEAALFINAHVFQDPGICAKEKPKTRRGDKD